MADKRNIAVQKLYIHGRVADARSGRTFPTVNPATGEIICEVQLADAADVDRAVQSAKRGFAAWSAMTGARRGRVLMNAVKLLRQRNRELAEIEVMDTGKPIAEAEAVDIL